MAEYRISGVWKNGNIITHYAFHEVVADGVTRSVKTSKAEAIRLLETGRNTAKTWLWDYSIANWRIGETVTVVDGKYLRSNPDSTVKDNLNHLINYDWINF